MRFNIACRRAVLEDAMIASLLRSQFAVAVQHTKADPRAGLNDWFSVVG